MHIISNGSHWAGEAPSTIRQLLDVLRTEPLDPSFEDYGNFVITDDPAIDGEVRLFGNFLTVSHVFSIDGTREELAEVIAAIRANQQTEAYQNDLQARIRARAEQEARPTATLNTVKESTIQDAMSALLTALGFEAMAREVKTETELDRLRKYARVVIKHSSPEVARKAANLFRLHRPSLY